jgi:hypothetical protein
MRQNSKNFLRRTLLRLVLIWASLITVPRAVQLDTVLHLSVSHGEDRWKNGAWYAFNIFRWPITFLLAEIHYQPVAWISAGSAFRTFDGAFSHERFCV